MLVHSHHSREHASTQTDMVMEEQLRVLNPHTQAAEKIEAGSCMGYGNLKAHP